MCRCNPLATKKRNEDELGPEDEQCYPHQALIWRGTNKCTGFLITSPGTCRQQRREVRTCFRRLPLQLLEHFGFNVINDDGVAGRFANVMLEHSGEDGTVEFVCG